MSGPDPGAVLRPELLGARAYGVQDATGLIKLDAMENPYTWPPEMVEGWLERLRTASVNRYPDPGARELKRRLRRVMRVPPGCAMILGNGSDELIQLLCLAVAGSGRRVMAPEPSFAMYRLTAELAGPGYAGVPLRAADYELDLDAMLAAIERDRPALVFLACPNNPTGNLFRAEAVRRVVRAAPGLAVLDEAYLAFAGRDHMEELAAYPNLLLMRTLSKLGLAGLRLGCLVGAKRWLDELDKLRLPYNINVLTQVSAAYALEHMPVLDRQVQAIRRERARMSERLAALPGVTVYPSQTNFLLLRTPQGAAGRVHAALRQAGVLVKKLDGTHPLVADCLRVTVGTPEENEAFLAALAAVL